MQHKQKIMRSKKLRKTPLFIILAMIIVVIAIIVALFMNFIKENDKSQSHTSLVSQETSSTSSITSTSTDEDSSSKAPSSEQSSKQATTKEVKVETIVPETVAVDDDYFKDAIFIGDSISKGLKFYGVVPEKNVIADQNVGLDQIYNNKDVYYISAREKTTLWNAIQAKLPNPKKIYVLLGSNGIPGFSNDRHIEFYSDLIDKLKQKFPDAVIYIESITPITKDSEYIRKTFNTAKINDFNDKILQLVKEKSVYFLNIQEILKDENGLLKSEYAASDGMHMKKEGHVAVYKYFKNHVVSKDGTAQIVDKGE